MQKRRKVTLTLEEAAQAWRAADDLLGMCYDAFTARRLTGREAVLDAETVFEKASQIWEALQRAADRRWHRGWRLLEKVG